MVLRVFRVVVLPPPVRLQVSRSQKALSASSHPRPPGAARARLAAHRLHTVTGPAAPRARAAVASASGRAVAHLHRAALIYHVELD